MFWIFADGTIEVEPFEITGTEAEFRAWLDENWITDAEFIFTNGSLSITYRTPSAEEGGEDFYYNYNYDPIVEIPGTRRDREPDEEWGFLAKDEPKAYSEDMLPAIMEAWAPQASLILRWEGTDDEGNPIKGAAEKIAPDTEVDLIPLER